MTERPAKTIEESGDRAAHLGSGASLEAAEAALDVLARAKLADRDDAWR